MNPSDFINSFSSKIKNLENAIRLGAYDGGKVLVKSLKLSMNERKTGRLYKRYIGIGGRLLKNPRLYRASSPNEISGKITGALRDSVGFEVKSYRNLIFGMGGSDLEYAKFQEYGTSKMKARKPIKKTVEKEQSKVSYLLSKRVSKLMNF